MKFSIITCTYNSEAHLQKNIDSVKNQTFQDFEHIFIDGNSSDKTIVIIKKYHDELPSDSVKFFQYPAKGIGNAMNKGIEKASGEYLIHLHSDDSFYNNDVLLNVNSFIKKNDSPDLIYGKAKFISENGSFKIIPHRRIYQKFRHWLLLLTNYIPHQATFIKKTVFEKYGSFDEQYKNSMDYEMWLRLSRRKINARFLNSIICNFSMRNESQSSENKTGASKENIAIQKDHVESKLLHLFLALITRINNKRKLI